MVVGGLAVSGSAVTTVDLYHALSATGRLIQINAVRRGEIVFCTIH
jgi:hypothetical protein